MPDSKWPRFNVGVVLNRACRDTIIKDLSATTSSGLRLVAIAELQGSVWCQKFAGESGIALFDDHRDLLTVEGLDLILECTGEASILSDIERHKTATVGVLDRQASMRLIELAKMYSTNPLASALLEASPDGVLVIDRKFLILDCNQSSEIPGGTNKDAVVGKHCFEVIANRSSPCESPPGGCVANEALRTGKPARKVYETRDQVDALQFRQITAYPILGRRGDISQFVLTIRDITKDVDKKIEECTKTVKEDFARLAQEDRLSSLGRLVASVCHEINNPIASIVTFNKVIRSILKSMPVSKSGQSKEVDTEMANVARYLDLSFREAMRCGSIVKNLLTFARPKGLEAKPIQIPELVDTILLLTEHQLELANIRYEVHFPSVPFTAHGDFARIQQCLLNLVFNAIDSMPNGGILTISGEIDESTDCACLEITDTGCGIDPKVLPRIFEPFYSTKTDGKGSGLGLPMVYGIIREHHGEVEVESELGKGSTFRIKLPRHPVNVQEGQHPADESSTRSGLSSLADYPFEQ
jgi:signal transduction histidine kinase